MGMENTTQLRQSAFSSGTAEAMGMENQNTSAALPQMAGREPLSQLHGPGQPGCPYASAAFTGANSWEVQGMNRKGHVDYGPLTPDYIPTLPQTLRQPGSRTKKEQQKRQARTKVRRLQGKNLHPLAVNAGGERQAGETIGKQVMASPQGLPGGSRAKLRSCRTAPSRLTAPSYSQLRPPSPPLDMVMQGGAVHALESRNQNWAPSRPSYSHPVPMAPPLDSNSNAANRPGCRGQPRLVHSHSGGAARAFPSTDGPARAQAKEQKGHVDYGPLTPDYNPTLLPLPPAPPLDTVRPGACFFKLRCVSLA